MTSIEKPDWCQSLSWDRVIAVLLVALVAAFVGTTGWMVLGSFIDLRPEESGARPRQLVTAPLVRGTTNRVLASSPAACSDQKCAMLDFRIDEFSTEAAIIKGEMRLTVPDEIKTRLWHSDQYVVVTDPQTGALSLKAEYEDWQLTLHILDTTGWGRGDTDTKIPLRSVFSSRDGELRQEQVIIPVQLATMGQDKAYPDDWHWSDTYVDVELPDPMWLRPEDGSFQSLLPIELYIASTAGMEGRNLLVRQSDDRSGIATHMDILVTRDVVTRTYVYTIALVPTVLGLVFAHMLLHKNRKNKEDIAVLLSQTAAVMLAVLPLRAVIVPTATTGLLKVDFVLGFGLALIVGAALLWYASHIWNTTTGVESTVSQNTAHDQKMPVEPEETPAENDALSKIASSAEPIGVDEAGPLHAALKDGTQKVDAEDTRLREKQ